MTHSFIAQLIVSAPNLKGTHFWMGMILDIVSHTKSVIADYW